MPKAELLLLHACAQDRLSLLLRVLRGVLLPS